MNRFRSITVFGCVFAACSAALIIKGHPGFGCVFGTWAVLCLLSFM